MSEFKSTIRSDASILTDGGIEETPLMFEPGIPFPPHVQVAALVTDSTDGHELRRIYESYVEAARSLGLRILGNYGTDDHHMRALAVRIARSCQ